MAKILIYVFLLSFVSFQLKAQGYINPDLIRSTTGISGSSKNILINSHNYVIQQSVGQSSVIGTFWGNNYVLRQGFIQPYISEKIQDGIETKSLNLHVYPNPVFEFLFLEFNEVINGELKITMIDMTGRLLFSETYQASQKIQLYVKDLSSGQYILKVISNDKNFIRKIIKN